ncbi:MAG: NAD(P)H-dependent oxidoreductase [Candidatus Eisenbacteria bacterium]|nr:NAD(P)H-dependent oxidoreductase [Candidatus Eisenbacteria bacterium]
MPPSVHVLGFAGSLRSGSYNRATLRAAAGLLPDGMTLEIFDRIGEIPLYNGDVEAQGEVPEPVLAFKERITAADALLIATPEYNHSVPGVLKNAIDWASRPARTSPLDGKPLAILGATTGMAGTARAQIALRQVCVFTNMHPLNKPEVLIARAAEKFDAEGRLHDEPTRERIAALLVALRDWALRVRVRVPG